MSGYGNLRTFLRKASIGTAKETKKKAVSSYEKASKGIASINRENSMKRRDKKIKERL